MEKFRGKFALDINVLIRIPSDAILKLFARKILVVRAFELSAVAPWRDG
jgi:hypothetical protein